jgi:16S rRNA G966 N2-methylase RsmD
LPAALRFINLQPDTDNYTFIDLGCGKGRMLLIAAQNGFQKIIGVEFASELVAVARENIRKMALENITVINADAIEFVFPPGNLVVYMYNPFQNKVLRPVLENLRRQLSGVLYIIYRNPRCAALLQNSEWLGYVGEVPQWEGSRGIHIWQSKVLF